VLLLLQLKSSPDALIPDRTVHGFSPMHSSPGTTQNTSTLTLKPYHAEKHKEVLYTFFVCFTLATAKDQKSF